jgi:hypothetical protein
LSPPQQASRRPFQLLVGGSFSTPPGDEHRVPTHFYRVLSDRFPEATFHPVSDYGVADPFTDYEAESRPVKAVGQKSYHQKAVGCTGAVPMDLRKTLASG